MNDIRIKLIFLSILIIGNVFTVSSVFEFNFIITKAESDFEGQLHIQFTSYDYVWLGTPYQLMKVNFNPRSSLSWVIKALSDEMHFEEISTFNPNLSLTYIEDKSRLHLFNNENILTGLEFKDKISFNKLALKNTTLVLGLDTQDNCVISSFGLLIDHPNIGSEPFIKQLYSRKIIEHLSFSIDYINNSIGKLTIGKDIVIEENEDRYLKVFEVGLKKQKYYDWGVAHVNNIYFGKSRIAGLLDSNIELCFDESFGFIQIPFNLRYRINHAYLKGLSCEEHNHNNIKKRTDFITYTYFLCKKEKMNNLLRNTFDDIIFEFNSSKISLKAKDLFKEFNNDTLIFSIVLAEEKKEQHWIIGAPILKNYKSVHNLDKDLLSLYLNLPYSKKTHILMKKLYIWTIGVISLIIPLYIKLYKEYSYFWFPQDVNNDLM